MRSSNLAMVAGLIAMGLSLSTATGKTDASDRYFCGSAPPGWVPPGQKRRPDPPDNPACHLMIREQRKKGHERP